MRGAAAILAGLAAASCAAPGRGGGWEALPAAEPGLRPAAVEAAPRPSFRSTLPEDPPTPSDGGHTRTGVYFGGGLHGGSARVAVRDSDPEDGPSGGGLLFAGYRFTPAFGIEVFADRRRARVEADDPFSRVELDLEAASRGIQFRVWLIEAFAKDRGPAAVAMRSGNTFQPYAVLGLGAGRMNGEVEVTGAGATTFEEEESSGFFRLGVGAEWCVARNLALFLQVDACGLGSEDLAWGSADLVGGILVRF
jgi:hypothetical protein